VSENPPENYVTLPFADGEYVFKLPVGQLVELQGKCGNVGVSQIFARLVSARFRDTQSGAVVFNPLTATFFYEDVAETIRLALIGGGEGLVDGKPVQVTPTLALKLVRDYVHARPLQESWTTAVAVLSAFMIGYTDPDKPEKKSPVKPTATQPEPEETASAG
jgi:hypothetical protein